MTEKKPIELHHSSDPKVKVTTNDDHVQAYLDAGFVRSVGESK